MKSLCVLLSGGFFGAGLVISGMTDPSVVLAFLTLDANWNPALILVMGSALVVTSGGYALVRHRGRPLFDTGFHLPDAIHVDLRLLTGAATFGAGWGLTGYCPGPAIVGAGTLDYRALLFLATFLAGVTAFEQVASRMSARVSMAADG